MTTSDPKLDELINTLESNMTSFFAQLPPTARNVI